MRFISTTLFFMVSLLLMMKAAEVHARNLPRDFQWVVVQEDNEFKVFKSDVEKSSGIIPLKVELTLPFPLIRVLAVLDQTERKKEWVPNMATAEVIQSVSPYEKLERGTYKAPWPVANREFVVRIKAEVDSKNKVVTAYMHSEETETVPLSDKFVRGETYNGNVTLRAIDENSTFMQMIFFNDFKGDLPKWIVNLVQKGWPTNFVSALKTQLSKKDIDVNEKFKALL